MKIFPPKSFHAWTKKNTFQHLRRCISLPHREQLLQILQISHNFFCHLPLSTVQITYPGCSISQHLSHFQVTLSSGSQDYHDLSRDQCRKIAAEHYVCITGLNATVVSCLAEPWASKTSSLVGALLCGRLSACGGGYRERKPPDVFLNIISLCCHYRSRWAFGCRRTHNKTDFWFPIFLKITHAGTPSEHLASAANYVSIFGHCTPTQQVSTSSHGERHA